MKFLVIGLGSMGKRRIRNLKFLNASEIIGFDVREDRRKEVESEHNVATFGTIDDAIGQNPDAFIISVPPAMHNEYTRLAIENKIPAFVEASVILDGLEDLNKLAKNNGVFIAPSCTLKFHPAIKDIRNIVKSMKYGRITNFSYHSGQYLPDWHPWENVKDFYVSKKETGGAREIVPFELTWIIDVVGFPKNIIGFCGHTMDVGADIDDTYVISMDLGDAYGNLTVDVTSRSATRSLIINMEQGQILWKWDDNIVKLYDAIDQRWITYQYPEGHTAEGYNKNIIEDMYIEEMESFIGSISGKDQYPNSLDEDIKVLELLNEMEGKL